MLNICFLFTCFNRREKTELCIRTIVAASSAYHISFWVCDDESTDGTRESLLDLSEELGVDIEVISTGGNCFYSKSMSVGMTAILNQEKMLSKIDYLCLINDDVVFYNNFLDVLINQSIMNVNSVVVGAICDADGKLSYGAIKYTKGYKYKKLDINESDSLADTFNANCVLIPVHIFRRVGAIDDKYIHSLGDFDYGLGIRRRGYSIFGTKLYVGVCDNNSNVGSWNDTTLSKIERLKLKESPKGAPLKQWFYFLNKNFGIIYAVFGSISPYIRILLT